MTAERSVTVRDLSRTYPGVNPVHALNRVSLEIQSGEFVALVGPSGSGKTTLLSLVGALDLPTAGSIHIEGQAITSLSPVERANLRRRRIGFVFQEHNLIPVLSAIENIEYVMLLQGVAESERRDRALSILDAVGLTGHADRRPSELSGGQQQRVAVARAIVTKPALVLADEPTANLDSATGQELLALFKHLNSEQSITFLLATHDQQVMQAAKRLIHMRDGTVVDSS